MPRQQLHIVAIFPEGAQPGITREMDYKEAIGRINAAGGAAILAHPAWSMNTLETMLTLEGVCAAEVFNAVSGVPLERRSRLFGDAAGHRGQSRAAV